jgi:acyl-CoA thioester hydrolase
MQEIFRGQVEARECDHYGHQNVRYYVRKIEDGIAHFLASHGYGPGKLAVSGLEVRWAEHHMRFLKELYAGTPVYAVGGTVEAGPDAVCLYAELRNSRTDAPAAAFTVGLALRERDTGELRAWPADLLEGLRGRTVEIPAHGTPRGLEPRPAPQAPSIAELEAAGYGVINRSVVAPWDLGASGRFGPDGVVAKHSEGFENFYARLVLPTRQDPSEIGWVMMEAHYHHRHAPVAGNLSLASKGLIAVGDKTLVPRIWIHEPESGLAIADSRFVIIRMDLKARAIKPFTDEERAVLEGQIVPDL